MLLSGIVQHEIPPYSITSSARARNTSGMLMPIFREVLICYITNLRTGLLIRPLMELSSSNLLGSK
jgi:hypothetical protein